MDYLDELVERRIAAAIDRGELDNLPGRGLPLDLDADALVPVELRAAYRILRNAGFVPPEIECLREIGELERLIERGDDRTANARAARRLELLWQRMEMRSPGARTRLRPYRDRLLERAGATGSE
jgi:hypothetical protein